MYYSLHCHVPCDVRSQSKKKLLWSWMLWKVLFPFQRKSFKDTNSIKNQKTKKPHPCTPCMVDPRVMKVEMATLARLICSSFPMLQSLATLGSHWVEFVPSMKLQKGCVDAKTPWAPPTALCWWTNVNIEWTVPLRNFTSSVPANLTQNSAD